MKKKEPTNPYGPLHGLGKETRLRRNIMMIITDRMIQEYLLLAYLLSAQWKLQSEEVHVRRDHCLFRKTVKMPFVTYFVDLGFLLIVMSMRV